MEAEEGEVIKESLLEGYSIPVSYDSTKKIINQMEKNICKVRIGSEKGTGFFCEIPFPDENNVLPVLITNNHVINEEALNKNNQLIYLDIKCEENIKTLNLNNRIKYTNKDYDITIIELKENDEINDYLTLDGGIINDIVNNINRNKDYLDTTVYIIQYPEGQLSVSYGILKTILEDKKYTFKHQCSTKNGSSGSPILNLENKVIGIHKEGCERFNRGSFLNYPIKEFIKLKYYGNNNINKNESLNTSIETNNTDLPSKEINKEIIYNKFYDSVNSVLILSDKRLCACSSDGSIKVFDIKNFYFDIKIDKLRAHNDKIWCIEEIQQNFLASGGKNDIKIWEIKNNNLSLINSINSAHSDYLNKIIKINNEQFASCARDGKVKIWSNKNYKEIACINAHNTYINSILKLNNNDLLVSGSNGESSLKFWNLNNFELYKSFNNIYSTAYNNTLLEVDDILFVGEKSGIRIFNLNTNFKPTFYKDNKIERVLCLYYIGNNMITAGSGTGFIYVYEIIRKPTLTLKNIIKIKNNIEAKIGNYNFNLAVSDLTFYSNYQKCFIISCSIDGSIKLYDFKNNEILE